MVQSVPASFFGTKELDLATFGGWLQESRIKSGISQRALATRANVSSAMISKLESDSVRPSLDMLEKLADALEVSRVEAKRAWLESEAGELTREPIFDPSRFEGYDELSPEFRDEVAEDIELATEIAIRRAREKQRRQGQGE